MEMNNEKLTGNKAQNKINNALFFLIFGFSFLIILFSACSIGGDIDAWRLRAQSGTQGLEYSLINNGASYSVSKGSADAAEVVIPAVWYNKPVTAIAENGFAGYAVMTSLLIPGSVKEIGQNAFGGCGGLAKVYYDGADITAWNSITLGSGNDSLVSAARYYYSDSMPGTSATHWRWVNGKAALWTSIIEVVWIPPAVSPFIMGSSDSLDSFASPPHHVTLTRGFYIGIYEVTQEQYLSVTGTNPSYFYSAPFAGDIQAKRPVDTVTWYNAVEFCNLLSQREGLTPVYIIDKSQPDPNNSNTYDPNKWIVYMNITANGYRLPTETEWEYACRAGTTTAYYTGDAIDGSTGWYFSNSNDLTHEVGRKSPNAWGLYDMHGNVWEWCWDWYGSYLSGAQTNPMGAGSGEFRVIRGGSCSYSMDGLRSAYRYGYYPHIGVREDFIGFRVVRN